MRVHGVLSWFDESPHWLATAVAGFGRFCDTIVAVDGAYALYPNARPKSHPNQVEAVVHTAEAMGCEVLLYQPTRAWGGNEVEKRNFCLQLVDTLAEDGDWLCVFDADYHVVSVNPDELRRALFQCDSPVATYRIIDGRDILEDPDFALYASTNAAPSEWVWDTRDLYRWHPTLRVGPVHYGYSTADGNLRGPGQTADVVDLGEHLVAYHRKQDRALVRKQAAEAYYEARANAGIEALV